jgi:hypothetical protein
MTVMRIIRTRNWHARLLKRPEGDLFEYIAVSYNRKRRHRSPGGLSPVDFEKKLGVEYA